MTKNESVRGSLVLLSGPSGSGKGTIVARVIDERDDTVVSVSATTRAPREGEIDGKHYFFRTREQFEQMIAAGDLLEWAQYSGNYYGTPRSYVEEQLSQGKNVVLEIDVQGAFKVLDAFPDTVSIFITIPSFAELESRLRGRGTETEERVRARLKAAVGELQLAGKYRYIVMNDELDDAVKAVHTIIDVEKMRSERMNNTILEVLKDAETYGY